MQKELELFLRNAKIVNQTNCITERNPYRFMRGGVWVTKWVIRLNTKIYGLSLTGFIENYENGIVETKLMFSTYGNWHISQKAFERREKIIKFLVKHGATYLYETPIKWFN